MQPEENIIGYRLSPQQQRLWRLRAITGTDPFRSVCVVELRGVLDVSRLERELALACRRHEALRTRFELLPGLDLPLQIVEDEPAAVRVRTVEAGGEHEASPARLLELESVCDGAAQGFGLRATAAETRDGRTLLLLSAPAMCADEASMLSLLEEVLGAYARGSEPTGEGEEVVQYVQFSEWQHELLAEPDAPSFWQRAAAVPSSNLPGQADARTPAAFSPRSLSAELNDGAMAALARLAIERGLSMEALLLACWQTLLWRLTGEPRVLVHVGSACRPFEEMAAAVGPYAKWLPLEADFGVEVSSVEVAERAQMALDEARSHEGYYRPGQELATRESSEDSNAASAFRTADTDIRPQGLLGFSYGERPSGDSNEAGGLGWRVLHAASLSERFRLRLSAASYADGLRLNFDYDAAVVDEEAVRRWSEAYMHMLEVASQRPSTPAAALPAVGERERRLLLRPCNFPKSDTTTSRASAGRDETVHGLFTRQAALTPDAPAVLCGDSRLSFSQLDSLSSRLASRLASLGVSRGSVVALLFDRSADMLVALLAALKAGAAYLPLDPSQPASRLRFVLADSGASALLTHRGLGLSLGLTSLPAVDLDSDSDSETPTPGGGCAEAPLPRVGGSDLAYVIYTSGSTGEPKGVMVEHSSAVALHAALRREVYEGAEAAAGGRRLRVSLNAPLYFDASVKQLLQLLSGHTLVVIPKGVRRDPAALLDHVGRQGVDVLDATPSLLRLLLDESEAGGGALPRVLLCGGEAIDDVLWGRLGGLGGVAAYNLYGPTECTVDSAAARVESGAARPTIGRAVAHAQLLVLDGEGGLAPTGAAGELYIGGEGVSRGYLNRASLTAERYVPHPWGAAGERLYRTGDVVRWGAGGGLEYVGRADRQVKLRGYRVELGEVEAALRRQPGVRDAAAALCGEAGRERLVAYVSGSAAADSDPLAGSQTHRLPDGRRVAHRNRNETDYLYEELFAKRSYFRHGVGLREDSVVFDVGANIGMFSVLALDECPTARVYAFEPLSEIAACLRANARAYGRGRVKVFGHGLSDGEREEEFSYYPRYTMMSGERRYADADSEVGVIERYLENESAGGSAEAGELLAHSRALLEGRFEERREACRLRRLAEVMREEGVEWVDLLKVDVQRAEADVLRGMDEWCWGRVGQVVMEVHDGERGGGGRVRELKEELGARGFRVEAEQDELLEGTDRWNLYAVRHDYEAAREEGLRRRAALDSAAGQLRGWRGEEAGLTEWELRAGVAQVLPEYMHPSHYVLLASLPLTRNGKVDYAALPGLEEIRARSEREYVAPRGELEEVIAGAWRRLLRAEKVSAHENFFDAGGHSLLMVQFYHALRSSVEGEFTLLDLFKHPTISLLAKHLSEGRAERKGPEKIHERVSKREEALRRQRQLKTERKIVNG